MSDKIFMKDITLPIVETGENETYSFVQTDADLDTAGDAADAKAVGDELTNLKQDLEGLDVYTLGLYPQMSVADTAVASFTDGADDIPVKSLTVDITPVQSGSGDPSPSNVRPISGWTGANVSVFDVNVWDEVWEQGSYSNSGEPVTTTSQIRSKNYIPVLPSTTYYMVANAGNRICFYDASKTFITAIFDKQNTTFTTPANCKYLRFNMGDAYGSTYNHNISINYPSTDHDYHAYKGNVYSISFPTSAGTVYGGTLDVTNGVLTVDRAGRVLNGSENWKVNTASSGLFYVSDEDTLHGIKLDGDIISSEYIKTSASGASMTVGQMKIVNRYVNFKTSYADLDAWKTALASHNVTLVYELATPVTYQLDPIAVATILGQNNIFADTGNVNELTYRADLKAYIDAHVGS